MTKGVIGVDLPIVAVPQPAAIGFADEFALALVFIGYGFAGGAQRSFFAVYSTGVFDA
jgi:hypothetical protein